MHGTTEWIAEADCIVGRAYKLDARNIRVGIWDGITFHGVRTKFGGTFMDDEYHWDIGAPNGTAKPIELLGEENV